MTDDHPELFIYHKYAESQGRSWITVYHVHLLYIIDNGSGTFPYVRHDDHIPLSNKPQQDILQDSYEIYSNYIASHDKYKKCISKCQVLSFNFKDFFRAQNQMEEYRRHSSLIWGK